MKKVLALIMVVLMMTSAGIALADVDTAITFQEIPWGSDAETVRQVLIEKEYISEDTEFSCYEGRGFHLIPNKTMHVVSESGTDYNAVQFVMSSNKILKQIAGYDVNRMECSFAKNGDDAELLCVKVMLNAQRIDEAYADLAAKLASIYGKSKHGNFVGIMYNDVWYGDNNTVVMLLVDRDEINLYYGTLDADSILQECLANFSNGVDSNDTSGL